MDIYEIAGQYWGVLLVPIVAALLALFLAAATQK